MHGVIVQHAVCHGTGVGCNTDGSVIKFCFELDTVYVVDLTLEWPNIRTYEHPKKFILYTFRQQGNLLHF